MRKTEAAIAVTAVVAVSVLIASRSAEAESVRPATGGVASTSDGSAWVFTGDKIEYCYLNENGRPICEAARRY